MACILAYQHIHYFSWTKSVQIFFSIIALLAISQEEYQHNFHCIRKSLSQAARRSYHTHGAELHYSWASICGQICLWQRMWQPPTPSISVMSKSSRDLHIETSSVLLHQCKIWMGDTTLTISSTRSGRSWGTLTSFIWGVRNHWFSRKKLSMFLLFWVQSSKIVA